MSKKLFLCVNIWENLWYFFNFSFRFRTPQKKRTGATACFEERRGLLGGLLGGGGRFPIFHQMRHKVENKERGVPRHPKKVEKKNIPTS